VKEITFLDVGLDRMASINVTTKNYHLRMWAGLISLQNSTCVGLLLIR